jgi:gliding motility-associated-like protein
MKNIISVFILTGIVITGFFFGFTNSSTEDLREKHKYFLNQSPVRESLKLSKKERKANGFPPNKYFEREWELTLNPATGKPEPEKVLQLQEKLSKQNLLRRAPGDTDTNPWIERGPNNVGGRTRTLLFDPNDSANQKVFAGGVSGGLWTNDAITNVNSSWIQVSGVPGNMNVSCITVDPRNSNIWYLGTGEQYTSGAAVGNGVYKSIDGGVNWTNISLQAIGIGSLEGSNADGDVVSLLLAGVYFINDIVAWDNGIRTELFLGVGSHVYGDSSDPLNILGSQSAGLYTSKNGGNTWSRIESTAMRYAVNENLNFYFIPNDLEISADNTLWLGGIATPAFGITGGGKVFNSTDGETWNLVTTLEDSNRVELEVSSVNANKMYALTQGTTNEGPHIFTTNDAFETHTELSKPDDVDTDIDANDFTRGQSFYNLMIEVDPNNDAILYVGGIDLFRSENGGTSWSQISKWSNNNNLRNLSTSLVHADQHAMIFRPGDSNQAVFGNDGGVYFASSLTLASTNRTVISAVNSDYNVTQFYHGAIAPSVSNEFFLAGAQDNGTQLLDTPNKTQPDMSEKILGGDGAYCFVDQIGQDYLIVSLQNNRFFLHNLNDNTERKINNDADDGDFINPGALDSNLDILYVNGTNSREVKVYSYSGLLTISQAGLATKNTLSNALLDASPTAFKVSPYITTSSTLLVGTETGKLLQVTNANTNSASWLDISDDEFLGSVSDIEFGKSDNEIFVTFHNYGVRSIWFSDDAGESWENKEGDLPDFPVKAILQNPIDENEIIVGTELGVWKSGNFHDNFPNWVQAYNGMSDVKVTDLQLRAEDNTVLATTYGRGMFTGVFRNENPEFFISVNEDPTAEVTSVDDVISYTVNYDVINGFDEDVSFEVTGNPEGSSVNFNASQPLLINSKGIVEIEVNDIEGNMAGEYELTLTGTSFSVVKKVYLFLNILDADNDNILDTDDNCELLYNPKQLDVDEDFIGDICDDNIKISHQIPKGFTPNNDGTNDVWILEKVQEMYPNNELEVYNRTGKLVYRAKPYLNDWRGKSNVGGNQKLPIGSYIYIFKSGEPTAIFYPDAYAKKGWVYIKY